MEEREKQKLRNYYLKFANISLFCSNLSYKDLSEKVVNNFWLAKGLDTAIVLAAVKEGNSLESAAYLLSQSPYLLDKTKKTPEMKEYCLKIIDNVRLHLKRNLISYD